MTILRFSACIEWLFADEADDLPGRIRAAAEAGLNGVEFWRHSNRDLGPIRAALDETGLPLAGIVCEPFAPLTDAAAHDLFARSLDASIAAAQVLGAPLLIAQAGDDRAGTSRLLQHVSIVRGLREAARQLDSTGIVLALEPLNDRVDHPGYYLTSTVEGLDIVDEVDRPEVRLLYDIYHSAVMGEAIEEVLAGRVDRVAHVHLADMPGRGEPGSGGLDFEDRLEWLAAAGYAGCVGLEYRPTGPTRASLGFLHSV